MLFVISHNCFFPWVVLYYNRQGEREANSDRALPKQEANSDRALQKNLKKIQKTP